MLNMIKNVENNSTVIDIWWPIPVAVMSLLTSLTLLVLNNFFFTFCLVLNIFLYLTI